MPQNKSTKFMDTVIFTLYNYASNQREEYLLLKLFKTALEEEIKWELHSVFFIEYGSLFNILVPNLQLYLCEML